MKGSTLPRGLLRNQETYREPWKTEGRLAPAVTAAVWARRFLLRFLWCLRGLILWTGTCKKEEQADFVIGSLVIRCFIFSNVFWLYDECLITGHSQVPRRSSRKPICSLRESMRSSCWKEWDSKVVFSDRPSSSDRGKTLVKGASTICSFYGGTVNVGHCLRHRAELRRTFLRYLFQELHSALQALHLLCNILQQADPSTCRHHTNVLMLGALNATFKGRSPEIDGSLPSVNKG